MSKPKKVVVGGMTVSIEFVPDITDEADRNAFVYGVFRPSQQRILIRADLPLETQRSTLLHEILHAAYHYCPQFTKMEYAYKNTITEEDIVRNTEQALFPTLTDPRNRAAWNFILDR